jgi:signal transduction histidine kinase
MTAADEDVDKPYKCAHLAGRAREPGREDCGEKLSEGAKQYLGYVRDSAQHMARLIDDLLALSRVTRAELDRTETDLSSIATLRRR